MKTRVLFLVLALLGLLVLVFSVSAAPTPAAKQPAAKQQPAIQAIGATTESPLLFVENTGQWDAAARFQMRQGRATLWLADDGLWLTLLSEETISLDEVLQPTNPSAAHRLQQIHLPQRGVHLRLNFIGANENTVLEAFDPAATKVSYFTGSDPAGWRPDAPVWSGIRYTDLYPGWDLEITEESGNFVWRLVSTRLNTPLPDVRLSLEGADGVTLDKASVLLNTAAGDFALPFIQAPLSRAQLAATTITGNMIHAPLMNNQPSATSNQPPGILHDDPDDLLYSTFIGGSEYENGYSVAVDEDGAAYVTGDTYSSDFPDTPGAFDTTHNGSSDAYVAKLSADGSTLLYATYVGSNGTDYSRDIVVDDAGNAYVVVGTYSGNFPTTAGAFDTSFNGSHDTVAFKLNTSGSDLVYSTFLGGGAEDYNEGIVVDESGQAFVIGETWSSNFPTTAGAYDTSYNGSGDVFAVKLNAAGSALLYGTFIGGTNYDCWDCAPATDGDGALYITGYTKSNNYPTTAGAYDTSYNGAWDGFVTKLNPAGSALDYSTYLGSFDDDCYEDCDIAVDDEGAAYIVGNTYSNNFPTTAGAYDTTKDGSRDAFITKLTPAGDALVYSTFLGGDSTEQAHNAKVDQAGNLYIVGKTSSNDFPTTDGAFDTSHNGLTDTFITQLNDEGSELLYSTFLGGSSSECGYDCTLALAADNTVYVAGYTDSAGFPTTDGAYDTTYNGDGDAFAAHLNLGVYCGEGFAIPDNDPAGASSSLTITDTTSVIDMDVSLSVDHTFVGDLVFNLTHEDTGASATLVHRPGGPPPPYCSGDDVETTLDDEAADPVEDECAAATPTIDGTFWPNEPLSVFDLQTLDGTWTLTALDAAANDVGEVVDWCLLPTLEPEPVSLVKTVGTDPNECATTDFVDVHPGDAVTYCYTVTNNGLTTLTTHDLVDDQLGVILDDYAYNLTPGASTFVTMTAALPETTLNDATWTAFVPSGPSASGSDTATAYVVPLGCSQPLLAIADDGTVTDDLTIADGGEIGDVDIYLLAQHTWVSDLKFSVQHVDTGTAVTIIDRPGLPPQPPCSGDDIDATLDDEADEPVEDQCAVSTPTILGDFTPNNPLSAFDGEDVAGTWRLTIQDMQRNDVGVLTMWCVEATAGPPVIDVEPEALASIQATDEIVTLPLTISNNGGSNLEWSLSENATWATVSTNSGVTPPAESSLVNVTFDSLNLVTGVYTDTLTITSDDPLSPVVTVPLTLTVTCEANCLRSAGILLQARQQGGNSGVLGRVLVHDEDGAPVVNAAVYAEWSVNLASGLSFNLPVDITNGSGIAQFALVSGPGTYTLTIVDITKPDYLFDPANSVLSKTIEVPGGRGVE